MKYSLKLLAGLVAIGFSVSVGLTAVAQQSPGTQPNLDQTPAQPAGSTPGTRDADQPANAAPNSPQSEVSVPMDMEKASIDAIVSRSSSFNLLNTLVRVADSRGAKVGTLLAGQSGHTVFAPTDAAFLALPAGTIKLLVQPENQKTLVKILSQHVVKGKLLSSAIQPGSKKPLKGDTLDIQASGGGVTVNGAQVIRADIQAGNGVIHAIDRVLLPADVQASLNLTPRAAGSPN